MVYRRHTHKQTQTAEKSVMGSRTKKKLPNNRYGFSNTNKCQTIDMVSRTQTNAKQSIWFLEHKQSPNNRYGFSKTNNCQTIDMVSRTQTIAQQSIMVFRSRAKITEESVSFPYTQKIAEQSIMVSEHTQRLSTSPTQQFASYES